MGIEEDEQALEQIKKFFPDYAKRDEIRQIKMREIVEMDGALNCLTWARIHIEYML
jgi:agmatine deiminase